jgi:uncharacterized protein (DUF736 family)
MIIGNFELVDGSYLGLIEMLGTSTTAVFKAQERGPDYVIVCPQQGSDIEFGAAWKRTSRDRKPYLSVRLDSPMLPEPINCALLEQEGGTYALVWSRRRVAELKAG